jgi:hypothetical protein
MRRINMLLWCFFTCGLIATHSLIAQEQKPKGEQADEISKLVGNWSGESVCADREKFPACHDEQVIYRVVVAPGRSDTLTITMDKIVDGKPETMGTSDFVYNAREQILVSEIKTNRWRLIFELAVKGDLLEGTLATLPDRTLVRRIKVKKDK